MYPLLLIRVLIGCGIATFSVGIGRCRTGSAVPQEGPGRGGGFLAFTAWLPSFWTAMYDTDLRQAGLLIAGFSLLTALIRVPGGLLSDRVSIRYALAGNFLLMLAGTLVLSFAATFTLSLLATLAVGAGMGLQNAIVFKLLPRYVPDAIGGASGWIGSLGALGDFLIPPLMGAATEFTTGADAYARGFLPFAAHVSVANLNRWSAKHHITG